MKKLALLVGINDYQTINDLKGCINDVTNVRSVLKTFFGFSNLDIRVLVDSRATKDNILSRLDFLVRSGKKGDHLIFHFSGHGSQIVDRHGDDLNVNLDELICPYDMNWDNGFITDDMLKEILDRLPAGVKMEILLDCCHSGTGTRDIAPAAGIAQGDGFYKERYLEPPVDIYCRYDGDEDRLKMKRLVRGVGVDVPLNHVLWAGCKSDQSSADALIEGRYNGAFSYYFCKHLREARGNISREDLHTRVKNSLRFHKYSQIPQLECKNVLKDDKVFS